VLERQTIDGRPCTVAYLTFDFAPATRDRYDVAKLIFDDGEVVFLVDKPAPDIKQ
jgi:hypothetical protein